MQQVVHTRGYWDNVTERYIHVAILSIELTLSCWGEVQQTGYIAFVTALPVPMEVCISTTCHLPPLKTQSPTTVTPLSPGMTEVNAIRATVIQ